MRKFALLALVLCGQSAYAQLTDNPTFIYGAGSKTCGAFLESRRVPNKGSDYQFGQWILGFIGGFNSTTLGPQFSDQLTIEVALAHMDKYCRENPSDALVMSARKLVDDSVNKRKR